MTSYHLAPEWARQDAVILVWPSQHSDWAKQTNHADLLNNVEQTYLELTHYLSRHQIVFLITQNQDHKNIVETHLAQKNIAFTNIHFIEIPTNDTWVRDFGPIAVQSNKSEEIYKLLDFNFDAWGEKYPYDKDNAFNQNFISSLDIKLSYEKVDFTLEAGNLEINSKGALLTSSTCFKRNLASQNLNRELLETKLHDWLGCSNVCWIDDVVLAGDDTDGHIDNLARFCDDTIITYSALGHDHEPNSHALQLLVEQLNSIAKNNAYELVPLTMPEPIIVNGVQLPASYTNFLISNEYVLVPVFNDKHDNNALKMIDDCFPSKEIVDIESNALIQQFGGIHCASMQIPQGFIA
ncbi:MAG: agmatine deiminase family protein [Pseudomonadota bacterium]